MHLIGVHLIGVHLIGVHLIGVRLIGMGLRRLSDFSISVFGKSSLMSVPLSRDGTL
jgi:hypothetical protein